MSRMEQYANLHRYATKIAEDDLTDDVGPEATAAVAVGRVLGAIGNSIEETAQRLGQSNDQAAVEKFLDGVSEIALDAASMINILVTDVPQFADLPDYAGTLLKDAAHDFEDGDHINVLVEANEFLVTRKAVSE